MEEFLNGFKIWTKKLNTIVDGARVYYRNVTFNTLNRSKNRMIRVYLPSSYDFANPDSRFPVLYMMDGKNLFDDYTSFVGEWGIDETLEEMIYKGETKGIIVVGIDAPKLGRDRTLEMFPEDVVPTKESKITQRGYANFLGDFIFKELKPLIDSTFYTLTDKSHTAVGGSSMGGLMAFYLATNYSNYVGYSLAFSPAFFLLEDKSLDRFLLEKVNRSVGKIYFYVGGEGFESLFVDTTFKAYQYMKDFGFSDDDIKIVYDQSKEHNEKAWRIYFPDAIRFFNYFK